MLSVEYCRKFACTHLKYNIDNNYNKVMVCEITGKMPRSMEMCPELEAML